MHGGELFAESAAVIGLVVAGGWVVWIMRQARDNAVRDGSWHTPWGDVSEIPPEMRPGRNVFGRGDSRESNDLAGNAINHERTPNQRPLGGGL
jgi:hypothetical protein